MEPKETSIFNGWVEEQKQINSPINYGEMELKIFASEDLYWKWTMTSEIKNVEIEDRRVLMDCEGRAKAVSYNKCQWRWKLVGTRVLEIKEEWYPEGEILTIEIWWYIYWHRKCLRFDHWNG